MKRLCLLLVGAAMVGAATTAWAARAEARQDYGRAKVFFAPEICRVCGELDNPEHCKCTSGQDQ